MSIIFEKTETYGFEGAIRGMRNPLNSWEKSDSGVYGSSVGHKNFIIGPEDMALMQRLIAAGPEHAKFLRQIFVSVDITAPLYWWKEFDTYKVGTVANSCSTMHTIHKKRFTRDDFSHDHLSASSTGYIPVAINDTTCLYEAEGILQLVIEALNSYRELYLLTKDKEYWYAMIQLLPSSYNQKRTVTMNYANLRSMYFQRRNHKLDEWRIGFCDWVKSLDWAKELIIFGGENGAKEDGIGES